MNTYLELARMVCMGWKPYDYEAVLSAITFYRDGTTSLNRGDHLLLSEAIQVLLSMRSLKAVLSENIVEPNNVSQPVKRRGRPPGSKNKGIEMMHD